MNLLSDVRLGVDLGIVTDVSVEALNTLTSNVGQAAIAESNATGQKRLSGEQARAKLIRDVLEVPALDPDEPIEDVADKPTDDPAEEQIIEENKEETNNTETSEDIDDQAEQKDSKE